MTYRIGHFFADYGVESEILSTVGSVVRVTIDPEPNEFVDETIQADLMDETPDLDLDLGVFHPRCTDVSRMTSISGSTDDHENQIPRARELARQVADDYIIENRPRDDLRDPAVLNGRMFGLPIEYERAFETSFPVKTPPRERTLGKKTVSPYFYPDRSAEWWRSVKGYRGGYPTEHLAKNAIPAQYIQFIVRSWLEARNGRDTATPRDNSGTYREVTTEQATLVGRQ
jgi:hypothetical protein